MNENIVFPPVAPRARSTCWKMDTSLNGGQFSRKPTQQVQSSSYQVLLKSFGETRYLYQKCQPKPKLCNDIFSS